MAASSSASHGVDSRPEPKAAIGCPCSYSVWQLCIRTSGGNSGCRGCLEVPLFDHQRSLAVGSYPVGSATLVVSKRTYVWHPPPLRDNPSWLPPTRRTLMALNSSARYGDDSPTSPSRNSLVGDTSLGGGGEADRADRKDPRREPMLLPSMGGMEE
jgi:hypothetical protein